MWSFETYYGLDDYKYDLTRNLHYAFAYAYEYLWALPRPTAVAVLVLVAVLLLLLLVLVLVLVLKLRSKSKSKDGTHSQNHKAGECVRVPAQVKVKVAKDDLSVSDTNSNSNSNSNNNSNNSPKEERLTPLKVLGPQVTTLEFPVLVPPSALRHDARPLIQQPWNLNVQQGTFALLGHRLSVSCVQNVTAVPPCAGGVLQLTYMEPKKHSHSHSQIQIHKQKQKQKHNKQSNINPNINPNANTSSGSGSGSGATLEETASVATTIASRGNDRLAADQWHKSSSRDDDNNTHMSERNGNGDPDGDSYTAGAHHTIRPGDLLARFSVGLTPIFNNAKEKDTDHYGTSSQGQGQGQADNDSGSVSSVTHSKHTERVPAGEERLQEGTFASARASAEFQRALLAMRLVGTQLRHLFQALEMLHCGSEAHPGQDVLSDVIVWDAKDKVLEHATAPPETNSNDAETETTTTATSGKTAKDSTSEKKPSKQMHASHHVAGVAMDDVLRCLGTIPSIRRNLDRHYAYHYPANRAAIPLSVGDTHHSIDESDSVSKSTPMEEETADVTDVISAGINYLYRENRRLLLGYVDFLRLFVPSLEEGSVPYVNPTANALQEHKTRVQWAVMLRKVVARAALFVRDYVRAKRLVNQGWTIPRPRDLPSHPDPLSDSTIPKLSLLRRLPFDSDEDNIRHDMPAKNEYYEATVSRDVRCNVHSKKHMETPGSSVPSQYQGYALVGCNTFQLPPSASSTEGKNHPLRPTRDPLSAIPSLLHLTRDNPSLDFFVSAFFPEGPRIAIVFVFVRTLPKGLDPSFDTIMNRYTTGTAEDRNRKLELYMHLGPGPGLSTLSWAALKALSGILRWAKRGEPQIPFKSGNANDRTPFPGMTWSRYTKTKHFGGSLQTDSTMPKNYVAVTSHIDGDRIRNIAIKILYQRLEDDALPSSIIDFTFVVEGENIDELPERALGNVRLVHVNGRGVALPISYSAKSEEKSIGSNSVLHDTQGTRLPNQCFEIDSPQESDGLGSMSQNLVTPPRVRNSINVQAAEDVTSERQVPLLSSGSPQNIDGDFIAAAHGGGSFEHASVDTESLPEPRSIELDEYNVVAPYSAGVDALLEILESITVPVRKEQLDDETVRVRTAMGCIDEVVTNNITDSPVGNGNDTFDAASLQRFQKEEMVNVSVLRNLNRSDLERFYVASDSNLKTAAIRIVESAAWRGVTFPVDIRVCRIELQSGQFFQYGRDKEGNPVFYFRNMCMGPWRKDVNAVVFAILHRLEASMKRLALQKPDVRCTLVVLMGSPVSEMVSENYNQGRISKDDESVQSESTSTTRNSQRSRKSAKMKKKQVNALGSDQSLLNPFSIGANPRIDYSGEDYQVHTNFALVQRLNEVLSRHYPERLAKALIVPSSGWIKTLGTFGLRAYVSAPKTRSRVFMLGSSHDLKKYVEEDELVTIVGGRAFVPPEAFIC
eukprot:scaffold11316_cov60-Attheya_sp.AAC.2